MGDRGLWFQPGWRRSEHVRAPRWAPREEVLLAVRRLLHGERVSVAGHHVTLDDVGLEQPPSPPPPLLAGVRGPKSLALVGRVADGVVLAEPATPSTVRVALEQCAAPGDFHVVAFSRCSASPPTGAARLPQCDAVVGWAARPTHGWTAVGAALSDLLDWYERYGAEWLVDLPTDWWADLGPIGTFEDAWRICTG